MFTVVVTGGRHFDDAEVIREALTDLLKAHISTGLVVHVGDATGADTITRALCAKLGIPYTVHYADWQKYGRAAGPMRNRAMLDAANPDLVLAFPGEDESRGTRDCIRAAEAKNIPVQVFGDPVA
jgi:YspA, cpYpsA-related SLOG family